MLQYSGWIPSCDIHSTSSKEIHRKCMVSDMCSQTITNVILEQELYWIQGKLISRYDNFISGQLTSSDYNATLIDILVIVTDYC